MPAKKTSKQKRSTAVRVDDFRQKVAGENFQMLEFISNYHNRKPSQMVSHLIELEFKKIKRKKS